MGKWLNRNSGPLNVVILGKRIRSRHWFVANASHPGLSDRRKDKTSVDKHPLVCIPPSTFANHVHIAHLAYVRGLCSRQNRRRDFSTTSICPRESSCECQGAERFWKTP